MEHTRPLPSALLSWSSVHAALLLSAAAAVAAGAPLSLPSACAAISFAALIYLCRGRWTPAGRFGAANAITFMRLGGILALPALDPFPLACLALALFMLDGIDGWLARRSGLASEFGEYADKESDALLVLMLCLLLYRLPAGPGAWILVPGLLRYLFVLFVAVARPPVAHEHRSVRAGWISVLMILSLIACFATYPAQLAYTSALAATMTLLLCASFAESTCRLYRLAGVRAQ